MIEPQAGAQLSPHIVSMLCGPVHVSGQNGEPREHFGLERFGPELRENGRFGVHTGTEPMFACQV